MGRDINKYYFIIPYGFGDAMFCCSFYECLKTKFQSEIVFVIRPQHAILMWMYDIDSYVVKNFSENELFEIAESNRNPIKGEYYVAHPHFGNKKRIEEDFLNIKISFVEMFKRFWEIKEKELLSSPKRWPSMTEDLKSKIKGIDLEKTILIAPEMNSASRTEKIPYEWYFKLIEQYELDGYTVLVNAYKDKQLFAKNYIELEINELIALAINVKKVVTSRSGFSDIIYPKVKNMEIIYPNLAFFRMYRMTDIFEINNTNVYEKIVSISAKLELLNVKSVAIYGFGQVGHRLLYSLQNEGIDVDYVLDNRRIEEYRYYGLNEELPRVDAVIITIIDNENNIKKMINKKGLSAINLSEIMKTI